MSGGSETVLHICYSSPYFNFQLALSGMRRTELKQVPFGNKWLGDPHLVFSLEAPSAIIFKFSFILNKELQTSKSLINCII